MDWLMFGSFCVRFVCKGECFNVNWGEVLMLKQKMAGYVNKVVVLDTSTKWIYIGTLVEEDNSFFVLKEVDAFDVSDTALSKQEYVRMVKKDGVAPNRSKALVLKTIVTGITLVEDILI
jgi:hypothetical protein